MSAIRTILEYGKADIMKLRNFRQMARYDECDVILVVNDKIKITKKDKVKITKTIDKSS